MTRYRSFAFIFLLAHGALALSPEDAQTALRKTCGFFREDIAVHGGYVWQHSADLAKREGEGKALPKQVWVQPPGTPYVGEAFLAAYEATGDTYYLNAAKETAHALVQGQLVSGGWDYRIQFDPERRSEFAYRAHNPPGKGNVSTLDDNTTQAALSFLIDVDAATEHSDPEIGEAVAYALTKLCEAQYPNGAWPQRFSAPPDPAKYPVLKANYPESWTREYVQRDYKHDYTFNDGGIKDMIDLMLLARGAYGDARFRDTALRAGDFIILAQMPDPQPGWAQQYDAMMQPVWARKFEPPSVCGGESQSVMRTLISLFHETGESRFLEPIPKALAYYKSSLLPDGRLARFYELQTNRPLYFTKDYKLTYSSDDMPTHYAFIVGSALDAIEAEYKEAKDNGPSPKGASSPPTLTPELEKLATEAIQTLDIRGAWVEPGRLNYHGDEDSTREVIRSATFVKNVRALCNYILASKSESGGADGK
ncbi:MAG: pectate lyase [Candidatus Hydrogenedentes bacterium]|nr:pectate lyase [Candidatus Hydrogenedentota bacterium]